MKTESIAKLVLGAATLLIAACHDHEKSQGVDEYIKDCESAGSNEPFAGDEAYAAVVDALAAGKLTAIDQRAPNLSGPVGTLSRTTPPAFTFNVPELVTDLGPGRTRLRRWGACRPEPPGFLSRALARLGILGIAHAHCPAFSGENYLLRVFGPDDDVTAAAPLYTAFLSVTTFTPDATLWAARMAGAPSRVKVHIVRATLSQGRGVARPLRGDRAAPVRRDPVNRTARGFAAGFTALCAALGAGCGDQDIAAARLGQRLFSDPELSTSPFNRFSCATCHVNDPTAGPVVPGRFDPGFNLHGAPYRASWWGGYERSLLDAINVCVASFMGGRTFTKEDPQARQLYEYLAETPPAPMPAAPLTLVLNITALRELTGDAEKGRGVWNAACQRCHGEAFTGKGLLDPRAGIVPRDTEREFPGQAREVVIEKIRHGRFFGIAGVMPLYAKESMSDQDVVDLITFLGL